MARKARTGSHPMTPAFRLLATVLMGLDAPAAGLLETPTQRHDVREAWFSLAAARRALRDTDGALAALAIALAQHVLPPVEHIAPLADAIVAEAGLPGWCGLLRNDRVMPGARTAPAPVFPTHGVASPSCRLCPRGNPNRIEGHRRPPARRQPDPGAVARRTEGVVAARSGGIEGWACDPPTPAPIRCRRCAHGTVALHHHRHRHGHAQHGGLGRPRRIDRGSRSARRAAAAC